MNLVLTSILLGQMIVTSYRSVPSQTDSTPNHTSTGERVSPYGVAVSQDRMCKACLKLHRRCDRPDVDLVIHYGDVLFIPAVGFRHVNDVMGRYKTEWVKTKQGMKKIKHRQDNWLDIWVPSEQAERRFHSTYGIRKHKIWLVKGQVKHT